MNKARKRKKVIPFRMTQEQQAAAQTDFDSVPVTTMCQSIQMLIDNLSSRGYPVFDWDNKDKSVKQIGFIGGKVYFLATKEGEDKDEKKTT